jgi:hypothetical protein
MISRGDSKLRLPTSRPQQRGASAAADSFWVVPVDRPAHDDLRTDYDEWTLMLSIQSVKPSDTNRNVMNGRRNVRYVRYVIAGEGTIGNHKMNLSHYIRMQRRGTARHKQSSTSSLPTWTTSEDLRLITVTTHSSHVLYRFKL